MLQTFIQFATNEGFEFFLAFLLGGLIGLEREIKDKPVGLRTTILVCMGSTLFMIVSEKVAQVGSFDPGRIGAQVVTGLGFLCAGTIMNSGVNIQGLTTAATIWVVGAIGLAIGSHQYLTAIGATIIILIVLVFLGKVEGYIRKLHF